MTLNRFSHRKRAARGAALGWIALLATMLALICGAVGMLLNESRIAVHRSASSELASLSVVIAQDIESNIRSYDLSIEGVIHDLRLPTVAAAPVEVRRMILFDHAAAAPFLGAIDVFDAAGRLFISSKVDAAPDPDPSGKDYFKVHLARSDVGLYVGRPMLSKADGKLVIELSRRVTNADGSFGGVAVGTLQLDYFQHLFSGMKLGPNAAVSLFRDDGTMLMRRPLDPRMIGKVFKPGSLLERAAHAHGGEYEAKSAIDGVERIVRFDRVGRLPLVLAVTASVEDVFADWRRKAFGISAMVAICCAVIVTLAFRLRVELTRRIEAEAALGLLADEDALTGLANRRRFDAHLHKTWTAALRSEAPISLLLIDADRFKGFNDTFGHPAGDDALRALSHCMKEVARGPDDLVARFGGEEFAIILPATEAGDAFRIAEELRDRVLSLAVPHPLSRCGLLTVSVGVAACVPQAKDPPRSLIAAADAALYQAKNDGRNKAVLGAGQARRVA